MFISKHVDKKMKGRVFMAFERDVEDGRIPVLTNNK
jgi:hypothetical protein